MSVQSSTIFVDVTYELVQDAGSTPAMSICTLRVVVCVGFVPRGIR